MEALLSATRERFPSVPVLVVDDGSSDNTAAVAAANADAVLRMPYNAGVGCAMQAAYLYAAENGYRAVLRLDSDGQHPPQEAMKLVERRLESGADLVVGARSGERVSSRFRSLGGKILSRFLSFVCKTKISDPTSGFWLVSSPLLEYFAMDFPVEYPEPEGIALMRRLGYSYAEAAVSFEARKHGTSSIGRLDTVYFIVKVGMALVVDRLRSLSRRHYRCTLAKSVELKRRYGRCGSRVESA